VYVLNPAGQLKAAALQLGISDGRYSEVVSGALQAGDQVVIGENGATVDANSAGGPPGGGMRMRMF
jgi:hypothetical protein